MERKLRKIYSRTFHGGRNAAASLIDRFFIFFIAFVSIYLIVRTKIESRVVCIIIGLFTSLTFFIISALLDRRRFDKHILKLRTEAKRDVKRRKLALLEDADYCNAVFSEDTPYSYPIPSAECVTADDIRRAYRKAIALGYDKVLIIAYAAPTEAAQKLIKSLYGVVSITTPFEYLEGKAIDSLEVTEEEIDRELISKYYPEKPEGGLLKRLRPFARERAFRYLGVGVLLFICSAFMRYSLYFRILSTLSMSVGSSLLIWQSVRNNMGHRENKSDVSTD